MLGNDHFKPFPNIAKLLYQKNSAHSKSPGKYRDFVYSLKPLHTQWLLIFSNFLLNILKLQLYIRTNLD